MAVFIMIGSLASMDGTETPSTRRAKVWCMAYIVQTVDIKIIVVLTLRAYLFKFI